MSDNKKLALLSSLFGVLLVGLGILIKVSNNDNFGFDAIVMGAISIALGSVFWIRYFNEQQQKGDRKMLDITQTNDLIQEVDGILIIPDIRVWSHPHRIGKSGDDYFNVFGSFEEAHNFIETHPEAEKAPLIAFLGHEINIYPEPTS